VNCVFTLKEIFQTVTTTACCRDYMKGTVELMLDRDGQWSRMKEIK